MPHRPLLQSWSWRWEPVWVVPAVGVWPAVLVRALARPGSSAEGDAVALVSLVGGSLVGGSLVGGSLVGGSLVAALAFLLFAVCQRFVPMRVRTVRGGALGGLVVAAPVWTLFSAAVVAAGLSETSGYGALLVGRVVLLSPLTVGVGIALGAAVGRVRARVG